MSWVRHLNLRPYNKDLLESGAYDDIDTCIVANDSKDLIPTHITHIYNIQNRGISFETFQKLITLLDLETPTIKRNLLRSVQDELDNSGNFIQSYLSNYLKEQLMNSVIENMSQAIILLDQAGPNPLHQ